MADYINVQVVYAIPNVQKVIELKVKPGTTILKAVEESKIAEQFPEIDLDNLTVGIYAKLKPVDYILENDDRVEIYRELKVTKKIEKTTALKVEI